MNIAQNIVQMGAAPANAAMAEAFAQVMPDLVHEHLENLPDCARSEEIAHYQARLNFAHLQVRSRELQASAWDAYLLVADKVALLDGLLDEPAFEECPDARAAVTRRFLDLLAEQKRRFEVWQSLHALAFVRDENQLSPEKAQAAMAAVAWIEEQKADELLQSQTLLSARLTQNGARCAQEHAQAQAEAEAQVAAGTDDLPEGDHGGDESDQEDDDPFAGE